MSAIKAGLLERTKTSPGFAGYSFRIAFISLIRACLLFALLNIQEAHALHPWRIVVLTGGDPAQPAVLKLTRGLDAALLGSAPDGVEFYTDSLDGLRFNGADLMPEFLSLLKKKYQDRPVDVVIGLGDFALDFTKQYGKQVWPSVPVVIANTDKPLNEALPQEFHYLPMHIDIDGTLGIIESLQPDVHHLVVVGGDTAFDRYWTQRARDFALHRASHNWIVDTWNGSTLADLQQRLPTLGHDTAVLYTSLFRDREGRSYLPYEVVRTMTKASRVPIYGWYPLYLESGVTAGSMIDFEAYGRIAGLAASSIMLGKPVSFDAHSLAGTSRCVASVTQMQRFGISTSALPQGCELTNVPSSLWRENRVAVMFALAVVALQGLTIAGLLRQRRRLRIAGDEATVRRSELARAARFSAAGELSASIAHEVGQPLGAILTNADAADLMLQGETIDKDELYAILTDIRRDAFRADQVVQRLRMLLQKRPVTFAPIALDATLSDALALLAPEARRRRIVIESKLETDGALINGDRVQLEQVLLNLAINAMDAMQETEPDRRILSIFTHAATLGFHLVVADNGSGIPADAAEHLFESLYTTKPHGMGLGLSIVRTIVASHDGQICMSPRESGGSIFTVWLPALGSIPLAKRRTYKNVGSTDSVPTRRTT